MRVPDRAYGIETEYGCMVKQDGKILSDKDWPVDFLRNYVYRYADRGSCAISRVKRLWGVNGSLIYIDTGNHPEHASPEARSVRDAVIYSHVGDMLMRNLFGDKGSDVPQILLFKNNIARGESENEGNIWIQTFGCHENYCAYADQEAYYDPSFCAFLTTRQILDGSGCWDEHDTFFLSQRARALGPYSRCVPTLKTDDGGRVHLIYGDSNMLDCAAFLKLGTTTLMLSLVEAGYMPDMGYSSSTVRDLFDVSRGGAKERIILMRDGSKMSALELQYRYWAAARRGVSQATFQSDEVAAESELILQVWEQALNAIANNDRAWMVGRLDWATKLWLAEHEIVHYAKNEPYAVREIRNTVDLAYHSIMQPCMRECIYARWPERRLATDAQISYAMDNPPKGTRAQFRGTAIRKAAELSRQHQLIVDWPTIAFTSQQDFHLFTFRMPDPLDTYESLTESLKRCLQS